MLVLSRDVGEIIVVNDILKIKIMRVKGDTVRLAFEAPKGVEIFRKEIWDQIQEKKKKKSGEL
jgi:carbon storage regulator